MFKKALILLKWMIFPFLLAAQTNFSTQLIQWRTENDKPLKWASSLEWQAKEDLDKILEINTEDDQKIDEIVFANAKFFNEIRYIYFVSHEENDSKANKWVINSIASTEAGRNLLLSGQWISSAETVKTVNNTTIKYTLVLLVDP